MRSPLNREGVSLTVRPAEMAGKMASWLHGAALDWAWNYLVLPRYENALVVVTEQDVFLSAPFSSDSCPRSRGKRGIASGPNLQRGGAVQYGWTRAETLQ